MTTPFMRSRASYRSRVSSVWPYTTTELPPLYLCKSTRSIRPSWAMMKPSWISPSLSMRSPHWASRISAAKPCSSTPARMRPSTYSRLWRSSTMVSMPLRCKSCESMRPEGPPPMMQTWVFMVSPLWRAAHKTPLALLSCLAVLLVLSAAGRLARAASLSCVSRSVGLMTWVKTTTQRYVAQSPR